MKVLLVEDEKKVSALIRRGLEKELFTVESAFDGESGFELANNHSFDLIILDLMLPVLNGFEVLHRLRENNIKTPILILTAKDDIEDRIKGLDLGADDYLVKPFAFGELLARTRALLRRTQQKSSSSIRIGDLVVNMVTHEVHRGNRLIELTAKEYALLEFFISNVGRALNRVTIAEHVWHYNFDSGTNFIDVYINRLRKKLDQEGDEKLIHTVRGYGYILKSK